MYKKITLKLTFDYSHSVVCPSPSPTGLLYVGQHEFACTHPSDPSALVLGSTDATTCQVAVLRHPTSGVTAVAHLDGADGMGRNLRWGRRRDSTVQFVRLIDGPKSAVLPVN